MGHRIMWGFRREPSLLQAVHEAPPNVVEAGTVTPLPTQLPEVVRRAGKIQGKAWPRIARWSRRSLVLVLLLLGIQAGRTEAPSIYEVKASFVYNFAKFVQWPTKAFPNPKSPLILGVVGRDQFGETMAKLVEGKFLYQRPVSFRRVKWGSDMKGCHILFISSSESEKMKKLSALLEDAPVLTIGETPDFAERGGIIGIVDIFPEVKKVRFEINLQAAKRAHLTISSQLLRIAHIVK